jgi:hypothetical protein
MTAFEAYEKQTVPHSLLNRKGRKNLIKKVAKQEKLEVKKVKKLAEKLKQ